jgi:hypothetical protein
MPVLAAPEFRAIGKETDRRWEREDDVSLLNPRLVEYRPQESARLVIDPVLQHQARRHSIRALAAAAGVTPRVVRKLSAGADSKSNRAKSPKGTQDPWLTQTGIEDFPQFEVNLWPRSPYLSDMSWFRAASLILLLLPAAAGLAQAQQPAEPSAQSPAHRPAESSAPVRGNANTLKAVSILAAFFGGTAFFFALIRQVFEHRRWQQQVKVQADLHAKLLEQLTTRDDFREYLEGSTGRRLLEMMTTVSPGVDMPVGRVLWSVQAGVVLAAIGAGFWVARRAIGDSELLVAFDVISTLAIVTGVGFVLSAIVSWGLLRRFGLLRSAKGEP